MPQLSSRSIEVSRGLLLLGVVYVHALHWVVAMHADAQVDLWAQWQIKFLGGYVVLFFALAGMTQRHLADKPFSLVVSRSLMLLLLGAACHIGSVLIEQAVYMPSTHPYDLLRALAKPLVYGDVDTSAWFFLVLALVRVFAWLALRNWRMFLGVAAIAAAAVALSLVREWSLNFWGWRHWPAALLLFIVGMRVPPGWTVPHRWGAALFALALVLPLMNSPSVLRGDWCVFCDQDVLITPALGLQGPMPLLFWVQALVSVPALVWLAGGLCASPLARVLAYAGRHSHALLLLHAWLVPLTGYAALLPFTLDAPWLFLAVLVAGTIIHLASLRLLKVPLLDRTVKLCAWVAQRLAAAVALRRLAVDARRRRAHLSR
jgi:peptidoglycan/LPS O-acetylase OafA/YrhL